jgi:tRNA (cytidine/uridine-2'-O-)-methyltransferase
MFHVALWEPLIPPNTGNIARLCAATGARLHLIGKLGFRIDDATVKRAGLDYWEHVQVTHHPDWAAFLAAIGHSRIWLIDNPADRSYTRAEFADGDVLLFGSETKGLPERLREEHSARLVGIPMPAGKVRSLNLSNAVAVVLYEALRQTSDWTNATVSN